MPAQLAFEPRVAALIERLHAQSDAQGPELGTYFGRRAQAGELDWKGLDADAHRFMADKFVAFDRDKAEFCHQLCRALRATRVVEIGTSYGVSTLYLAAAVRANGGGVVVGTEYEPAKAKTARAHFQEAALADLICPGAVVIADNVSQFPEPYSDYFAYIHAPENRFSTMTLPFEGGLEMSVRTG